MKSFFINFCCLVLANLALGQSSHYWTDSYGTRSMLLSGVVMGSVEDLGAVYYNPARLTQFKTPAFVITGQVYELDKLSLRNALGDGIDLERSRFGGGPALVSGTFKLKFAGKSQFAYAFLTRINQDEDFTYSVDEFGNFLDSYPGDEYFSGAITNSNKYKDEWIGLSWSYPLSEQLSIGLTGFYSNVSRSAGVRYRLQAYSPQLQRTGMFTTARSYEYNSHSLLFKLGLSYKQPRWSAGLVITTPKIQGIGNASTNFETFSAGIDTTADNTGQDIYVLDGQGELSLTHKSPLAIGFGAGIRLGKRSLLHLGAEWFSAINDYTLLQSEPFIGQSNNQIYQMQVSNELSSVFNYGLGYEVYVSERISLFGSFASDYSARQKPPDLITDLGETVADNNIDANRYHFGFGTDLKTKFADLTLGVLYSSTRDQVERSFTIDDGMDPVTDNVDIIKHRWRFLVGFQFHFIDNLREKFEDKFN